MVVGRIWPYSVPLRKGVACGHGGSVVFGKKCSYISAGVACRGSIIRFLVSCYPTVTRHLLKHNIVPSAYCKVVSIENILNGKFICEVLAAREEALEGRFRVSEYGPFVGLDVGCSGLPL